jgi:uncharacterized phage protein (predicted DNA packaging)
MSYLSDVKDSLRITHDDDDNLLKRLIDSSAYECVAFLNVTLESTQDALDIIDELPPAVFNGLILMVQADYDGDPEKREAYRNAALNLWQPYRLDIGA